MKKQTLAITCIAGLLTGCGGGSISGSLVDQLGAEEAQAPVTAAAQPEETNPAPYVEAAVSNGELFAEVPETETSQIVTTANFLFDTAKSVNLQIDLNGAEGTQASLSLCTDYEATDSGYSVNYNSCSIKATMVDGHFNHQMELMNQYDSAIAVVWFPNQEFEPMYNEMNVADMTESESGYIWNWN